MKCATRPRKPDGSNRALSMAVIWQRKASQRYLLQSQAMFCRNYYDAMFYASEAAACSKWARFWLGVIE